ncbi:mycothiol system anti-sigma-R factor [Brevibacterium sp. BRM-1]|uniref:mycothiol system anti-sigma-R factor n=1 Tax=Brevibacterium sp. BRM-1 TaxID=2999062 RepID=UPI00227F709B|nr:mycothiol system anti-sigma-R factor [Brevibacterium sp. BRM-1]WAL40515.1 mycothiol system anti-sigma-R factor [Brevibacterium sp. BRM-1]
MSEERTPEAARFSPERLSSLERIYHYLDGELDASELGEIEHHLATCPECQSEYAIEAMLKQLVRRSCQSEEAPDGLRERIRARIVVEQRTIIARWNG